jgi:hypothetical protein
MHQEKCDLFSKSPSSSSFKFSALVSSILWSVLVIICWGRISFGIFFPRISQIILGCPNSLSKYFLINTNDDIKFGLIEKLNGPIGICKLHYDGLAI